VDELTALPPAPTDTKKGGDMTTTQTHIHIADNEEVQALCEEHGIDHDAFIVYCDNHHVTKDFESQVADFVDAYNGCWNNFLEFAEHIFDETMDVPDHLVRYIDYEAFARDLQHDYWETNGYVFRSH
jgi:antirestriction protein